APGNIGKQLIAIAEMAIGRGRADPRPTGCFGKGKARRAALGDQIERRPDQGLLEVSMVIATRAFTVLFAPTHVKGSYISPGAPSRFPERKSPPWRRQRK